MKKHPARYLSTAIAALLALAPLPGAYQAQAADHGDSPSAANDRAADIGDVYFFLDPNDNTQAIIVGTVQGFIVPGEAVNLAIFDPAVRYRFEFYTEHVNSPAPATDTTAAQKLAYSKKVVPTKSIDVTFSKRVAIDGPAGKEILQIPVSQEATLKFNGFSGLDNRGKFTEGLVTMTPGPILTTNPTLGTTEPTQIVTTITLGTGLGSAKFFAGEVDDPFFFDIPAFGKFIGSVRSGMPDVTAFTRARDTFAGYNTMAIAISVPVSLLKSSVAGNTKIGLSMVTQRHNAEVHTALGEVRGSGAYRAIDREGNPAVNVALVPFNSKNVYNASSPRDDAKGKFLGEVATVLGKLGTNSGNIDFLAKLAVTAGDLLVLETNIMLKPNSGTAGGNNMGSGFPNGRRLADDVIDTELSVITNGGVTSDGVAASDVAPINVFPFVAPAQQPSAPGVTDDKTRN